MSIDEIISGERIQAIADIYIGTGRLFNSNPYIDRSKCVEIGRINHSFYNPSVIFVICP